MQFHCIKMRLSIQIKNLLDNTPDQLPKFVTKSWIEINDQSRECIIPIVTLDLRPQC